MATDNLAKQLSASWGYPIDANSDQIFLQYAAQGQSFFNASGDSDAYPGAAYPPSDDPNITIVGGTTLTTSGPSGAWQSETVWNWGNGIGTGGGISTSIPIPTWQQGISMSANGGSTSFRNLPDVALTADNVYVVYGNGSSGNFGGTSCAAPLWAAFMALVNQQAAGNGGPMAGFLNPAVYALGKGSSYTSVFHDITTGNNTGSSSPTRFYGTVGYDLCTGWGTPNGNNMINALAGPPVPTPPSITTQPQSQTVATAGTAFFTVSVVGSFPLGYQWSYNTSNIPGATNSSLTLTNVQQAQAGSYAVLVTNAYGMTNSSNAVLTVNSPIPPSVVTQPSDQAVTVGNNGTFTITATGTPPLSYQWQFNGNNISNATNAALTLIAVQFADAGNYSVLVTSPYGSTNSFSAALSVNPAICSPPSAGLVSWWPGNSNANDLAGTNNGTVHGNVTYLTGQVGQAFSFNGSAGNGVAVGNPANLQLQNFTIDAWIQRGSTNRASLSTSGGLFFSYGDAGYGFGMDDNGQLLLSQVDYSQVVSSLLITDTDWHHVAVTKGGSAVVFYVDGVAYPAPVYNPNFTFGSPAAIGARGDSFANCFLGLIDEMDVLNRPLAASEIQAIYNAGSAGKCASSPPSITSQPVDQAATTGNIASFSVIAAGTSPLSYQWRYNGTNVNGATASSFSLVNVQPASAGNYSVVVTNTFGSVMSSNALLTVNPAICSAPPSGLVSWWPANYNASDLTGGNNGTLEGNLIYIQGEVGQAFSLNGSDGQGISVGAATNLYLQNFTIDAWIQRSSLSQASLNPYGGSIFAFGSGGYALGMFDNGQIYLTQIDVSYVGSSFQITDTIWHHVGVTKNGSTVVFYVDGVAYPAGTYNPVFQFNSAAAIGARGDNFANSFLGAIDEVDVFNRPLAASEIQAIYNAAIAGKCDGSVPPSIITQPANQSVYTDANAKFSVIAAGSQPLNYQWHFNGTNIAGAVNPVLTLTNVQASNAGNYSVTVVNSFGSVTSSNAALTVNPAICSPPSAGLVSWWPGNGNASDPASGNNGTLQGSVTYVNGEVGQAFSFTANGQGVVVGNPVSLRLQTFTIEAWVQRASTSLVNSSGQDGLLFSYGSGGYGFGLSHVNGNVILSQIDASNVTLGQGVTDTNWHHVAVTASGGTVIFYIDGVAYAAPAYVPNYTFGTSAAIGARGDNLSAGFYGSIDEISVYNRVLSAAEIQAIYNAQSAGKCTSSPPSITSQPASLSTVAGNNAIFTVITAGTAPFNYQWQFNGTNLSGATSSILTLVNV
ncbi:MAG TPA: LamG-like jellyroll fold domain-containing protein, partial [Verrucomicrobiae bacterium]|nr:LamG-like jellyroll fold domain-containing protein [Verrucomicrobiae bacterium]